MEEITQEFIFLQAYQAGGWRRAEPTPKHADVRSKQGGGVQCEGGYPLRMLMS